MELYFVELLPDILSLMLVIALIIISRQNLKVTKEPEEEMFL